jgi:SsrA-binding protein
LAADPGVRRSRPAAPTPGGSGRGGGAAARGRGAPDGEIQTIAENRRARHDYFIEDSVEAGLVLTGTEIRSIRAGRVQLRDAYARVERGECWLLGMHVAPFAWGNRFNHDPTRPRKLLLHRREIEQLRAHARQAGRTLVPLRLYLRRGRAKVEIGLVRGKHAYDKREAIAERDRLRELQRELAGRRERRP